MSAIFALVSRRCFRRFLSVFQNPDGLHTEEKKVDVVFFFFGMDLCLYEKVSVNVMKRVSAVLREGGAFIQYRDDFGSTPS